MYTLPSSTSGFPDQYVVENRLCSEMKNFIFNMPFDKLEFLFQMRFDSMNL